MTDYLPKVSDADVLRVIERDFPIELREKVYKALASHTAEHWHSPGDRVYLAVLKLADGDIGEVERQLKIAQMDFRDVIAPDEYPSVCRLGLVAVDKLSREEKDKLTYADWVQYEKWLRK